MPGQFILSFDCEGKWGVADDLGSPHARQLTDQRLHAAYRAIVDLLDEYDVDATFAFVGAFAQSPAALRKSRPLIEEMLRVFPTYLAPAVRQIDDGREGWHGDALLDLIGTAKASHEIALHGVTHVPWTSMDRERAKMEMAIFDGLDGPVRKSRTFVYPRNLVAHSDVLAERGFAGYRAARRDRSRAASLISEFNVWQTPDHADHRDRIVNIPAGFFVNWRHGLRSLVPPSVTRLRARRLLDAAARSNGVVHYWLHPENIVSAPATLELLRMLIREVAEAREAGRCEVLTQLAYCRQQQSLR
jgi:peptidoglycan/xylan/chitin deacetylase (PgdA/CDA1 family)